MTWAWESAPVASLSEKGVLMALANEAGPDGCNAFPSTNTIAEQAMCSPDHAKKVLADLRERGIIAYGNQAAAEYLPANKRPKVYDIQIPAAWYSSEQLKKVNAERAQKGLPPLTPDNRPPLGPAPERKTRSDKGVPNPSRSRKQHITGDEESRGVSQTPQEQSNADPAADLGIHLGGVSETPQGEGARGVSQTPARGVSQTPNPVTTKTNPENLPPLRGEDLTAHERAGTREYPDGQGSVNARTPAQPTENGDGEKHEQAGKPKGKHPLPKDWAPTPQMIADMQAECYGVDLELETRMFRDYWVDKKTSTVDGWNGTWRNWIRKAWKELGSPKAPAAPSLFDEPEQAGPDPSLVTKANEVVDWWFGVCATRGPVLDSARGGAQALVVETLLAGGTQQQAAKALQACGEPCPPKWKYQKALLGLEAQGGGGAASRDEVRQRHVDLQYGRGLLDAQRRKAEGTADDPLVSMMEAMYAATADAAQALQDAGEFPGDETGVPFTPPVDHTPRKEIANGH